MLKLSAAAARGPAGRMLVDALRAGPGAGQAQRHRCAADEIERVSRTRACWRWRRRRMRCRRKCARCAAGRGAAELPTSTLRKQQRDLYADLDRRHGSGAAGGSCRRPGGRAAASAASAAHRRDQAAYVQAFDALKSQQLRRSPSAAFKQFLRAIRKSDLADNAQYWLGEAYYVTPRLRQCRGRLPRGRRALAEFAQGARCACEARLHAV